jgi:CBS domain-containing protein
MWDRDCGAIAVVRSDGRLAGMLTDRDVCMAALTQGRPLNEILVHTAMSKHLVAGHPDQTVAEIEQVMADKQLRRIPIVDNDSKPIGIVTLNDLAIESVQPDTRMKHSLAKIAHTLAAICRPRLLDREAA